LRAELAARLTREQIADGDAQAMEWTRSSSVKQ
ncbi:sel1 repeat family protein, partial [Salmonella enterica subsp. enterica]|nr:sel1 repeat family protein [Salmonella enterica subsp. enterica]